MEKEFVPYDLAVKLKALGFDEPCFGKYDIYGSFDHKLFYYNHDSETSLNCSAPTYSQAFRWFREKYNWTIKVNQVTKNNWSYTLDNFPKDRTYYGEVYKTYEEAELECLNKLIEFVETKSE